MPVSFLLLYDAWCVVYTLTGIQVGMKGRDLLDHVFDHLNVVEKDYFGICYQADTNKMVGESASNLGLYV